MIKITVKSAKSSTRLTYVCDFVFGQALGLSWQLETNSADDQIHLTMENAAYLTLENQGILFEEDITDKTDKVYRSFIKSWSREKSFSSTDVLGTIFYLVSRYEEYVISSRDQHLRFMAQSSALFQSGLIETPVVDELISILRSKLETTFNLKCKPASYALVSTIDVDHPWYREHLKFPFYLRKKKIVDGQDPFDTYNKIIAAHQAIPIKPIFFFLHGGRPPYEKIKRYRSFAYRNLIQKLVKSESVKTGVHPSYASANDKKSLTESIELYTKNAGQRPQHSRQHYLRLDIEHTYRMLIEQGIEHDYTLGFADHVGFRAGTAKSFLWFDLRRNETTSLWLHPLTAMDVTLRNYMNLSPKLALQKLVGLRECIMKFGGQFNLLWHNSSLSEYDGWQSYAQMYFEFLDLHKSS